MNYICPMLFFFVLLSSCGSQKELQKTNADLQTANRELTEKNKSLSDRNRELEDQLGALNKTAQSMNVSFSEYKDECEQAKEDLAELESELEEVSSTLEGIMEKISRAMDDFSDKGVEVYRKDGQIYVQLEDDLLYKSGSAVLDARGKKALGSLAAALNEYPNLQVLVVGHTDDRLFKKGIDNWTLSTERANGVVRILRDNYNVEPSRLIAAGKGRFDPVADNSTAEGKAKNRRTEIILNPDFRRLWESVEHEKNKK